MDETVGNEILQECRGPLFSVAGRFKPGDKQYVLNSVQQNDNALNDKAARRLKMNNTQIHSNILTIAAVQRCNNLQFDACIASIEGHPVYHDICIADYYPRDDSPKCVREMPLDRNCMGAWVIDPWMNISCSFEAYPDRAFDKLLKWHAEGKHILRGENRKVGLGSISYDPSDPKFLSAFFVGKLSFHPVSEVFLPAHRFWMTKAANRSAPE